MIKKLIYQDDKSNKFWNIETSGKNFTVTFGKTGTAGQSQTKEFESVEECNKEAEKLIKEKLKKGYAENQGKTVKTEKNQGTEQPTDTKVKSIDDYTINITLERINIVKVYEKVDEKKKKLIWQFNLEKNDMPIEFDSFFNSTQFVIMDNQGKFWVYDIQKKKNIFYCNFKSTLVPAAHLSDDNKQIYLLLYLDGVHKISVMSLDNFKIINEIKIEIKTELSYWIDIFPCLWIYKKGELLIYYREEKKDHKWTHGFLTVDLKSKGIKKYEMPSARPGTVNHTFPWLDLKNGIGVRRYYDLEIKKVDGKDVFLSKVAVFDLNNFKDIAVITAREYTTEQLWVRDELEETEQLKEKDPVLVNDFMDRIASVRFSDKDYFWICYRGGILRKISTDGLHLSAYIIAKPKNKNDFESKDPLKDSNFNIFDMKIVDEKEIRLNAYPAFYRGVLPDIDIFKSKVPVVVNLEEYNPNQALTVTSDEKEKSSEISANVIEIKDISKKESLLNALDKIEKLTQNIKAITHGDYLNFIIKDSNNKKLQEKKFFDLIAAYPEALPKIKKIIKNFTSYPKAEDLYIDEETTALAYAAEVLVLSDPKHIDSYLEYLSVIDMEHDVINREKIIPKLLKKWKNTEAEYRFRAGIIFDYDLYDEYFLEELTKKKEFYKWFIKKENMKKSAEWICRVVKNKKELIEMLSEDESMEDEMSVFITYIKSTPK